MTISINWDKEQPDIILVEVIGQWQWQEYQQHVQVLSNMIASVSHRVDIICDLTQSSSITQEQVASRQVKRGRDTMPHNHGISVVINPDLKMRVALSMGSALSAKKEQPIQYAYSLEEAYHIIKTQRRQMSV